MQQIVKYWIACDGPHCGMGVERERPIADVTSAQAFVDQLPPGWIVTDDGLVFCHHHSGLSP